MGWGLGEDIRDCYQCIATKYQPGDKLFLFGFSRGAFTARCLAAVICKYGIVELAAEADPERTIRRIYSEGYRGRKQLSALKFHPGSRSVNFLGVWDTVGALGIPDDKALLNWLDNPSRYEFHDTSLNHKVLHARHAVALDQRRGSFSPTLWDTRKLTAKHDVRQVWFPGVHCDVGGGYKERGLSDGALKWMMDESEQAGVVYRPDALKQLSPDPCDVLHDSHTGLMKMLVTAPRTIPRLDAKDLLDESVRTRREYPPIDQPAYLPDRPFVRNQVQFDVYAKQPWNWTGAYLKAGHTYEFKATGQWVDRDFSCGPEGLGGGVGIGHLLGDLAGVAENAYAKFADYQQTDFFGTTRCRKGRWFELIGAIADGGNPKRDGTHDPLTTIAIGKGCKRTPRRSGYLFCFANDAWGFYGNNRGFVTVTVTKTSGRKSGENSR